MRELSPDCMLWKGLDSSLKLSGESVLEMDNSDLVCLFHTKYYAIDFLLLLHTMLSSGDGRKLQVLTLSSARLKKMEKGRTYQKKTNLLEREKKNQMRKNELK